jgi:hypothetical protein
MLPPVKDTAGMRVQNASPSLTARIDLPGQQDRLRQMILYISEKCVEAEQFGLVKLNKILWKADFEAFASRRKPVTGRPYQRLELGPAPKEMKPVLMEMETDGIIRFDLTDFGEGIIEKRPIALAEPHLINFTPDDLKFVVRAIGYYWDKTGMETSDDSHGIAWKSRANGDLMYYELSYLSDEEISPRQRTSILNKIAARR